MPLRGKTILVTRVPERSSEMIAEIERLGGRAVLFPTIRITDPESWDSCDKAIADISTYENLIFTSTNAVAKFFDRCRFLGVQAQEFTRMSVYAVGSKTRAAIEERGVSVAAIPESFSSHELGRYLGAGSLHGKRFLFPRGNLSGEDLVRILSTKGATVDAVTVYRTLGAGRDDVAHVDALLRVGGIDVVTFASPSAARNFFTTLVDEPLRRNSGRPAIAVIGGTTASAVLSLGFPVDIVAKESTGIGLVNAVAEYFKNTE